MDTSMATFSLDIGVPGDLFRLQTLLFGFVCYIYGSIPFAYLFTRLIKKEDLTKKGTGNIGVANAFGVGGLRAGFLTVAAEISKVLLPLALSKYFYDGVLLASLFFVFVSLLGNNFSVFLKGKGGMGTTMLLGTLLILSPYSFLAFSAVFIVLFYITRNSKITALVGYSLLPVELFLVERNIPFALFGLLAAMLYCTRYRGSRSDYAFYIKSGRGIITGVRKRYVENIRRAKRPSLVGHKACNLCYLMKSGFRVPKTYVCTCEAFEDYFSSGNSVLNSLRTELKRLIDEDRTYCIRSSANLEDERDYSFAGQFESYTNIRSLEQIIKSIVDIWESARGDRVAVYINRAGRSVEDIRMAVIIQEQIVPEFSGVVFTKNPTNGMDETILELVSGLGDSLVQRGITPDRWVYKWGNWTQRPEDKEAVLPVINQIVLQAKRIVKRYGKPLDLEWTYDGKEIYWLQLREITTLRSINVYSNRMAKEFMPGIIKPLVWSVNIAVVNTSWKRLFVELVGKAAKGIDINNLAKSFYYRAYFNMGIVGDIFELLGMPRESIELVIGLEVPRREGPKLKPSVRVFKYVPRMLLFAIQKSLYTQKLERFLVTQKQNYDLYASEEIAKLSEEEILYRIEQLLKANTEASYFVIISRLLAGLYTMVLRRLLAKERIDIHCVSFAKAREELKDIDLNYQLSKLHDKYDTLPEETKLRIQELNYDVLCKSSELSTFKNSVKEFLLRFGHLSESGNDFSRVTWKDAPILLLQMVTDYRKSETEKSDMLEISTLAKGTVRGAFLRYIYGKAAKYGVYKEKVDFLYGCGYGLFRPYFMHVARLFRDKGYISEEEDIFYFYFDEVREILKSGVMSEKYKVSLLKRKQEVAQYKDIDLPDLIVGDALPIPLTKSKVANRLKGLATSRGYCEGRVKVIKGMNDFSKIEDGDILVIPYSDVSWTPIFGKAKAVISESGGMLSHCSIVARECNIPAVVSVPDALKLEDGTLVAVDGCSGEILIMK